MNNAVQEVKEKVRNVLGELIELHPAKVPTDWISEYTGIADIEYLNPNEVGVRFLQYTPQSDQIIYHPVSPKQVLFLGGYYLIQEASDPGSWLVGDLGEAGFIDCWSRLDSLKDAMDAI